MHFYYCANPFNLSLSRRLFTFRMISCNNNENDFEICYFFFLELLFYANFTQYVTPVLPYKLMRFKERAFQHLPYVYIIYIIARFRLLLPNFFFLELFELMFLQLLILFLRLNFDVIRCKFKFMELDAMQNVPKHIKTKSI